jgi:hypothetical protein
VARPTVCLSVCHGVKHPSGAYEQIFITVRQLAGLLMCGALSDERTALPFTIAAGPSQRCHSRVRVPRDSWPYFTAPILDSPNLEGQVLVFISPRNRLAQLYPQVREALFAVSCDSQGYGGDIRTRLHAGYSHLNYDWLLLYNIGTDRQTKHFQSLIQTNVCWLLVSTETSSHNGLASKSPYPRKHVCQLVP